jgi:hypothetical protein
MTQRHPKSTHVTNKQMDAILIERDGITVYRVIKVVYGKPLVHYEKIWQEIQLIDGQWILRK